MILYHTSDQIIETPDILHSRDFLDFGKGFYLTHYREQAEKYGLRFKVRNRMPWVNSYNFEFLETEWSILKFEEYNQDWLEFIAKCRSGKDCSEYDLIIGGVADDKVIRTLDRYFLGEIGEEEALGLLKYEKPNIQYCIRSQEMLDKCLRFIEGVKI